MEKAYGSPSSSTAVYELRHCCEAYGVDGFKSVNELMEERIPQLRRMDIHLYKGGVGFHIQNKQNASRKIFPKFKILSPNPSISISSALIDVPFFLSSFFFLSFSFYIQMALKVKIHLTCTHLPHARLRRKVH